MAQGTDLAPLLVDLISRDAVVIPPYPGVAMRLQQLVNEGRYGTADVAKLISEEQVLAAAVLRAANVAAIRGRAPVTALTDAVNRVGVEEVGRVALAMSLGRMAAADGVLAELRRLSWRQSLEAALCCRQLAPARGLDAEEGFVCGLLHDFGRVVVIAAFEKILASLPDEPARSSEDWLMLVNRFHVDIGLVTAVRWNLPPLLQQVISTHHRPFAAAQARPMVEVVGLVDHVVEKWEDNPYVSEDELMTVPGLRGRVEVDLLMLVLPRLHRFLATFDDMVPAAVTPATSRVARRQRIPTGPPRQAALRATVVRTMGELPLDVESVTPDGLVVLGALRFKENNLVRLHLESSTGGTFDVSAKVVTSSPALGRFRSELVLFALTRETKELWEGVYARGV